jgi:hypothetical protein
MTPLHLRQTAGRMVEKIEALERLESACAFYHATQSLKDARHCRSPLLFRSLFFVC